jgi:hypothetical protein
LEGTILYKKLLVFSVFSLFLLTGCGDNEDGASIGTQEEPGNETREDLPGDNSTDNNTDDDGVSPSDTKGLEKDPND